MSDSVRPHPWDSPGKNTGVGCHFLLQCIKVKSESEVAQPCPTLPDPMQPTRLLRPWDFPDKSTGVGCHCLLLLLLSCVCLRFILTFAWLYILHSFFLIVFHCVEDYYYYFFGCTVWHGSSLTRDRTRAPCTENTES